MLGNQEAAIKLIEQGINYRLPMMVYLYVEPILKPLRSNPRFQELMRQVLGKETTFDPPERKYKKALFNKKQLGTIQTSTRNIDVRMKNHISIPI